MPNEIRFRVNAGKVLEALVLIAEARPGIDVFHVCKVLYFADKDHLNKYGRPILGDTYYALKQGPVPSLAYDMIERDERHLYEEILEKLSASLSYFKSKKDDYLRITATRTPNAEVFSDSDIDCLNSSIAAYADMDSKELWRIAHLEPGYNAVYREGKKPAEIGYQRIVQPDHPFYDDIIRDMAATSSLVVL